MRFQVWLLMVMIISLCAPPNVLAIEVDEYWPVKSKYPDSRITDTLAISKRYLRGIEEIATVHQPNTLDSTDEERAVTMPTGLSNAVSKVAEWVHKKLIQVIKLVAGRSAADKIEMKLTNNVYFPSLYRMKATPEYFLNRARQQVDPIKKINEEEAAKQFAAWIAKNHP
ncbi:RxLR effector protein [Phytophthora megakarya]|uniref:RxLR effector protein n=1 Tax=Phytophthora megakarya TaxID=4795 RepID=A0A225WHE8_9STRA|nr:RxLR effector protein [Phytophthora megakarya]